mgnify:CR=1 FL=1
MSRKRKAPKKIPIVDPKYKSVIIPKLINSIMLDGKKVLITGGTGSLGTALTKKLLESKVEAIRIYSRNEARQIAMENEFDDPRLRFLIGDVRDLDRLSKAMEDIDVALKHALGIRWAFMGPFEIMDLNAPEGIKDSFSRYRTGIQNLAKQQNTVPSYSDEYLNKLDKEQRQRLDYHDRSDRIEKRNKMIALIRKLKIELGEDV